MNYPLISVIVPIYKVEEYLLDCVKSITGQTYKNLEIILVDDGSPDLVPKIRVIGNTVDVNLFHHRKERDENNVPCIVTMAR